MEPQEQLPYSPGALDPTASEQEKWPFNDLALAAGHHLRIVHSEVEAAKVEGREPDEALIEEHRALARPAFKELYSQLHGTTHNLAKRLMGNEEDALDLVQDTYDRAWRGLRNFRGDSDVRTWLHRTTLNAASTALGRRNRHNKATPFSNFDFEEPNFAVDPIKSPSEKAEDSLLRTKVADALSNLSPKLKAVIVLRDIYDLPHDQIATELGISESAAKVRLFRARKQLKEEVFADQTLEEAKEA